MQDEWHVFEEEENQNKIAAYNHDNTESLEDRFRLLLRVIRTVEKIIICHSYMPGRARSR